MSEVSSTIGTNNNPSQPAPGPVEEMLGLSPKQQLALQALAAGKNITKAALAAGVTRQTVHEWRRTEPRFDTALKAWRRNALVSAQTILLENADNAAETIVDAVSAGDGYLAVEMLRSLSVMPTAAERAAQGQGIEA